jgi:hypothetical protein
VRRRVGDRGAPLRRGRPVTVEKRKWDGSVSARWTALLTREGPRMTWRTPPGTERARPRRGRTETTDHLEVSASCGEGWIVTAVIGADGEPARYEIDATAGEEVERDGVLAFTDLDLDMEVEEGAVAVTDLMQFAERREQMGYPPGLLSAAVLALDRALDRHRRGDWPFDGSLR